MTELLRSDLKSYLSSYPSGMPARTTDGSSFNTTMSEAAVRSVTLGGSGVGGGPNAATISSVGEQNGPSPTSFF
eukprot:CAMPEP_0204184348 /NCGR_PEP_ID=MMETSP0361-20130328/54378_1 /ASSEMBLY_ACC=CAM_ASM_000343 /TAXON_ID=268821 /ORGANISM="Scrippsiella Hangoei, Strain SHTV-5" /LENGTH=73 /DNA_ID=CAMNT_0051144365 /DNA_START=169 /DNA_END=387 /DNA_ORIENTATION=-